MINNIEILNPRHGFRAATIVVRRMKRAVIGCVCGTAVLAAISCAGAGDVPTAPSPVSSGTASKPGNGGVASPTASSRANEARPFHGSFRATETDTFEFPNTLVSDLIGTANTNYGEFSVASHEDIVLGESTAPGSGSFTLTASTGGTITGTLMVFGTYVPIGVRIVEEATITGGTGQFADATGTFTVNRSLNDATRRSSGSVNGTIGS